MIDLFSREKINIGRQLEFDLAKVLAIFFMAIIHVYGVMSGIAYKTMADSAFRIIIEFLGGPLAAPMFMFAMGVGMVYTKHNSPRDFAIRGVKLLATGYALNFLRFTILIMAADSLGIETSFGLTVVDTMGMVDILQFAGLAFFAIALMKKLELNCWNMLGIAVVLQGVGTLVDGNFTDMTLPLQYLVGLIFHVNSNTVFPITLWLVYPAAGICFANLLQRVADKRNFYKKIMLIGAIILAAVTAYAIGTGADIRAYFVLADDTFYIQNLLSSLWIIGILLIEISVCFILTGVISEIILKEVKFISTKVNMIYIIHWMIIPYSLAVMVCMGIEGMATAVIVPVGIFITISSMLIAKGISKLKYSNDPKINPI